MSVLLKVTGGAWLEIESDDLVLFSGHSSIRSTLDLLLNLIFIPAPPTSAFSTSMRTTFQCDTRRMSVLRGEDQRDIAFSEFLELRVEPFGTDWAIMAHLQQGDRVIVMLPQKDADTVRDALSQIGGSTGLACAV